MELDLVFFDSRVFAERTNQVLRAEQAWPGRNNLSLALAPTLAPRNPWGKHVWLLSSVFLLRRSVVPLEVVTSVC
jgi:hypothetical protein